MSANAPEVKRITTNTVQKMKAAGQKDLNDHGLRLFICKIFDTAGIDVILVGDSPST